MNTLLYKNEQACITLPNSVDDKQNIYLDNAFSEIELLSYVLCSDFLLARNTNLFELDCFTNKPIPFTGQWYTDGTYKWIDSLAYYVINYQIRLPYDFSNRIRKTKIALSPGLQKSYEEIISRIKHCDVSKTAIN